MTAYNVMKVLIEYLIMDNASVILDIMKTQIN